MAMRVQISLQFDDADLYQNFVVPYKEGRLLNSIIVKCLSSYYYNKDSRDIIEGVSMDDVVDNNPNDPNQSLCDSIRASLTMQDFLADKLQETLNKRTGDLVDILHQPNDFAEKSKTVDYSQFNLTGKAKPQPEPPKSDIDECISLIQKEADTLTNGIEKVAIGVADFNSHVEALQKLMSKPHISHHAPFDTAAIYSEQALMELRASLQNSLSNVNKVLDSKIPVEEPEEFDDELRLFD